MEEKRRSTRGQREVGKRERGSSCHGLHFGCLLLSSLSLSRARDIVTCPPCMHECNMGLRERCPLSVPACFPPPGSRVTPNHRLSARQDGEGMDMKEEVTLLLPCMYAYHTKAAAAAAPPSSLGRQTDRTGRGGGGQLHSPSSSSQVYLDSSPPPSSTPLPPPLPESHAKKASLTFSPCPSVRPFASALRRLLFLLPTPPQGRKRSKDKGERERDDRSLALGRG